MSLPASPESNLRMSSGDVCLAVEIYHLSDTDLGALGRIEACRSRASLPAQSTISSSWFRLETTSLSRLKHTTQKMTPI